MRVKWRIVGLSGLFGTSLWIIDAVFDTLFFYDRTFATLLVTNVPTHELYTRSMILGSFLLFGLIAARLAVHLEEQSRDVTLFRALLDEAHDSVFVIDPSTGDFVDVNETACEMLGYDRSELLELTVVDVNSDFENLKDFRHFITSSARKSLEAYETVHERADGTTFPVEISSTDVDIDDSTYRIAIAREITDRKERERQIHHYKQAVESSRDMLSAIDDEYEYLFANEAYCSFYDVDQTEIPGTSLSSVLTPEEFDRVDPNLQSALNGETVQFEMTRRGPDGAEVILDVRYFPLRDADGAIHGIGASLRDITGRKEMVRELRRSQKRYESLFNSIRDAIVVADTDRNIVDCNQAFTDLFGYRLEEIRGKSTEILYETVADYETFGDNIDRHAANSHFVQTIDYEKQSGHIFPGETNVFHLHDQEGDVTGYIGLIRDVSKREARLTQLKIIDRVLRHNLNNALTVIMGNADLIDRETGGQLSRYAKRIIRKGSELRETSEKEREITKFLTESRPVVKFDVAPVVRESVANVETRYSDANITLDTPEQQSVIAVKYLDRAIEELVENSVIHSDRDVPSVTVTVESAGENVEISVADDGPGIPEMERRVLAGDREIEPLFHGSGIGLWLVNLIVRHSDGTLSFSKNDPRGSVVRMRVPKPSEQRE